MGLVAIVLGVLAEGALLWVFDHLPGWLRFAALAPPVVMFVAGIVLIVRDRAKRRDTQKASRPRRPA